MRAFAIFCAVALAYLALAVALNLLPTELGDGINTTPLWKKLAIQVPITAAPVAALLAATTRRPVNRKRWLWTASALAVLGGAMVAIVG